MRVLQAYKTIQGTIVHSFPDYCNDQYVVGSELDGTDIGAYDRALVKRAPDLDYVPVEVLKLLKWAYDNGPTVHMMPGCRQSQVLRIRELISTLPKEENNV